MVTVASVIAVHRCQDVHGVRWDVPTDLRKVMEPCAACTSWGEYVAGAVLPYITVQPPAPDDCKLRGVIRRVVREVLNRRDAWAKSDRDCAVARAVAYQSVAGLLIRAIDEAPPTSDCGCHPDLHELGVHAPAGPKAPS